MVGAHADEIALLTHDVDQFELLEERCNGCESLADLGAGLD
jgi:hypothetical protein